MPTGLDILRAWGLPVFDGSPFIIAGPCSAESRQQILETALALQGLPVSLFRAGLWKPRTRPGGFEGVGETALAWLQEAREKTGLRLAVEIATPRQVELALQAKIDVLWIGARTSGNPFAVKELAQALAGIDQPVLVKNPLSPDLNLWLGSMERLQNAGVRKLGVILRGFGHSAPSKWRYEPEWNLGVGLRNHFPDLPYICDPSHIAGKAELIPQICQQALNLDFHGLMIETHCNPAAALSDPDQQLTPSQLADLLSRLVFKHLSAPTDETRKLLASFRLEIDSLDEELLRVLARRQQLVTQIGELKREHGLTILQAERWRQVLAKAQASGQELGLSPALVADIFNRIHEESLSRQQ